jgi:predicted acyltransferase
LRLVALEFSAEFKKDMPKTIWGKLGWVQESETGRVRSIDLFRGFCVSLMILGNYFLYFEAIPSALKHASPLADLTVIDFGAPIFFFIIGVSYGISFEKRLALRGIALAIGHFLLRYFLLWLFGLIGVFVLELKLEFGWNVLMAIGLAGLYALPFMGLKPIARFMAGIILLLIYQFVILKYLAEAVLGYDMGGYLGAISWAGLILISSIWWPILKSKNLKSMILSAIGFIFASSFVGLILNLRYPANKPLISLPYVLYSYSLGVLALLFFYLIDMYTKFDTALLRSFGRNPLFMYMFSSVLILAVQKVQKPDLAMPYIIFSGLAIYFICMFVAYYLDHKKLNIKV